MGEQRIDEMNDLLLEVMEDQKILGKEIKYLRDDLKAQNRLIGELLKIYKAHQETSNKQTKMISDLNRKLDERD